MQLNAYVKMKQDKFMLNLTPVQKQAAQNELAELKTKIIVWDYIEWKEQIDDFHPTP